MDEFEVEKKEILSVKEQLALYCPNYTYEDDINKFYYAEYKKYDKEFNLRIDLSFQYLVNFSLTKKSPIHRWFYYQEGYSPILINKILEYLNLIHNSSDIFLFDPFVGSGTSLVAAKELGIRSAGIEINPFSSFMAVTKTQNYSKDIIKSASNFKLPNYKRSNSVYDKYKLSIIKNLFNEESITKIELIKQSICLEENEKVRDILFTTLLSILQQVSYYKKAGNGLKKKRIYKEVDVNEAFNFKLKQIIEDLSIERPQIEPIVINDDCLNISNYNIENIDISIFSPPYANCFDYYEVYKIELWLGEFVKSYEELKVLRKSAITSNLNANINKKNLILKSSKLFLPIIDYLYTQNLWHNKIPQMLNSYFIEMQEILINLYARTKSGGYCVIVVGNSSYAGLAVPTDLILSEIARDIGFEVKEIIVARRNETSSQQYKKIGKLIEFIRESILIFRKNE